MLRWITALALAVVMIGPAYAHKAPVHTGRTRGYRKRAAPSCHAFKGEFVQLATKSGRRFEAYQVGSRSAAIGILLLPGARGLTEPVLAWADRLGARGYRVLAVNLYGRNRANRSRRAHRLSKSRARAEELTAIHLLRAPGRKIVTYGWGHTGSLQSLEASAADPADVSGTVLYGGGVSAKVSVVRRIQSLVFLVAFRSQTSLAALQAFEGRLRVYGKPLTVHYYNVAPAAVSPLGPHDHSALARQIGAMMRTFFGQVQVLCRRCAPYESALFNYRN